MVNAEAVAFQSGQVFSCWQRQLVQVFVRFVLWKASVTSPAFSVCVPCLVKVNSI